MPYDIEIPLQSDKKLDLDMTEQRGMHAVLLAGLAKVDTGLAERVHDAGVKPFTQALRAGKEEGYIWRVTLLDDSLYDPFCTGLTSLSPDRLLRNEIALDLDGRTEAHLTYEALSETETAQRFLVDFFTPTSFKQRYLHQPIPDPYRCFQSWWGRWQAFAPPKQALNVAVLDLVEAHMVISHYKLRSEMAQDGKRRVVGGVGQMTFLVIRRNKVDAAWQQGMTALGAFARFCGTGHKTTQGLGQTAVQLR
jgi:CRISPR-associated endoribonuclease Cas6